MLEQRLAQLKRELGRIRDRMATDREHADELMAEIIQLEQELEETQLPAQRRRFKLIQGGAIIVGTGAAAATEWVRNHPTATAIVTLASLGALLTAALTTPRNTPTGPPIALPAPAINAPAIPSPSTAPLVQAPSHPTATPPPAAAEPEPEDNDDARLTVSRPGAEPVVTSPARAPAPPDLNDPPVSSPPRTTPTRPSTPPLLAAACDGTVHLKLPPLLDVCLLG